MKFFKETSFKQEDKSQTIFETQKNKFKNIDLKEGEPCSHKGCLSHVTHPCEQCGRIAGKNN